MAKLVATGTVSKLAPSQRRRSAEFNSGRTYERYAGETTRGRVAGESAAAGGVAAAAAAGATSLSGAKLAGTPLGQHVLGSAERKMRTQHKITGQESAKLAGEQIHRYKRYGQWAAKNRLKATGGILGAGALAGGARLVQRARANEEAGISQGIGRMKAGEHYDRTAHRVGKSLVHTAALVSDLQAAGPKTRRAANWALTNRGKLVKTGLVTGGVVGTGTSARVAQNHSREAKRLRAELRTPVAKGGRAFALTGALTGSLGLGAGQSASRRGKKDDARELRAATIGGWAGQGVYQGAGYGAKHYSLRRIEPKTTKSTRNRALKPIKAAHGAYTPAMERHYPSKLPEHKIHRVLGWTHRGKTGTALGAAATAGGSALALEATKPKKHVDGNKRGVSKALYQREERLSPVRTAQVASGLGLLAWGAGRSRFLGSALNRGVKMARAKDNAQAVNALQLAMSAQGALRRGTAPAERSLRQIRRVNQAINAVPSGIRPEVAVAAGALLVGRGSPMHTTTYRPVSTTVRGPSYGW